MTQAKRKRLLRSPKLDKYFFSFLLFQFLLLGKGQIFCEECMINGIPSLYNIKCKSTKGELLVINELEFGRKLKHHEETMKALEHSCNQKARLVAKNILTGAYFRDLNDENLKK